MQEQNETLTVFELYIVEQVIDLLKHLRVETPDRFSETLNIPTSNSASRWKFKGSLSSTYNRTVAKRKSLDNFLLRTYN